MRELKYRAFIKEYKTMYDVNAIFFNSGFIRIDRLYGETEFMLDEVELLQYTGLKDRTGQEIYEGDIIELINEAGERVKAICKFGNRRLTTIEGITVDIQCFYFLIGDRKTNLVAVNYKGMHDLEIIEVRGNIYENPELLLDSDSVCYGCHHYTGDEDGCKPPTICIEGSLNNYIAN